MKFKELTEIETLRTNTYIDFEKALQDFRDKYSKDYDFDLNYSDTEHLIVLTENILEYNKEIHQDLSWTFNVKLIAVNKLQQTTSNGEYLTIEYIYEDNDSVNTKIKWEDIRL